MYEAVHARPDGDATVARFARDARDCGYDGVVVRNHGDARGDYDAERIREDHDVAVIEGLEIRADDPAQASGYIGNYRSDHDVLAVHGGTVEMNRFAVEQERVDVLAHPMRDEGDLNHVLAKAAAENGVRLEFSLAPVLRRHGGERVRAIGDLRKQRELVDAYDVPYVVSADPFSHLHLRAPRDLAAVAEEIGFDGEWLREGLREWGRLADRNRRRDSEEFIEPGVRRGRHEEER